ncbi:hypothetical protein BJX61DRAFT_551900 [Aspergillus egyptiacus]|nr:hypothetical protein BJX61DRAFT_551900 [Aspergillus egyptiacus]
MAVDLTVGQVSGIIAAGGVVLKLVLPSLHAFLFVGTLREQNNAATTTAISWSSIGRLLHSSYWPTILGSDSAALRGVPFRVLFFRYAGILSTVMISIAAIVTPLGLYEVVVPGDPVAEKFNHLPDEGIFGIGTLRRNNSVSWSRVCGGSREPFTCPDLTRVPSANNHSIDRHIPQGTVDLLTGGVSAGSSSISSIFDIQWRSWSWMRLLASNQGNASNSSLPRDPSYNEQYPIGTYRQISTLILENGYQVIEGLVVDMNNGGVGFRNHSAPSLTTYGSTWTEDLLFIQPVSTCVDTNLTLDYGIPENDARSLNSRTPITVTDRGGFSGLNTTYPVWNSVDVQSNPQLRERAYQAAWLSNIFAMGKFNISNVTLGSAPDQPLVLHMGSSVEGNRTFQLSETVPNDCWIDRQNPAAIAPNSFGCYATNSTGALPDGDTFDAAPRLISTCPPSPFGRQGGDFESSRGTIGNIATYCALVLGSSLRSDGVEDNWPFHTADSTWSKPMYSCAMAVEATIKTTTFSYNTTDGLAGLTVVNVTDKLYQSETEYPVWGVENLSEIGDFWMMPLWGIVSPDSAAKYASDGLQTVQKPSLYLPRISSFSRSSGLSTESHQNLPGVEFADNGLSAVSSMATSTLGSMDYTGEGNLALAQQWSRLSKSTDSMARVLNLVWTDYAANAVVGTKGSPGPGPDNDIRRAVTAYRVGIRYHLGYAAPGAIVLALLILTSALVLLALVLGRATLAKMKRYLNATSAGRVMVSVLHPPFVTTRNVDNDTPTSEWLETEGRMIISTGKTMKASILVKSFVASNGIMNHKP